VGDRLGEANTLAALSRLWLDADPERAEAYLNEAVGLHCEIGDVYSAGADYGNFGIALMQRHCWVEALPYVGKAGQILSACAVPHLMQQMEQLSVQCLQEIYRQLDAASCAAAAALHDLADTLQADGLISLAAHLRFTILSAQFQHELWREAAQTAERLLPATAPHEQAVAEHAEDKGAALNDEALAAAWGMLADARSNLAEEHGAAAAYAQAVAVAPGDARLRRNFADSLISLEAHDAASAQLDAAEILEPDAPYLALHRAALARARDNRPVAAQWAAEALRRRPAWEEAQAILLWAQAEPT
jgi:hypothetical protein